MDRVDLLVVMLVFYLGLSAWAYRDVGIRRAGPSRREPAPVRTGKKVSASYWQVVFSLITIGVGVVLITGGAGLVVRGLVGAAGWTVFALGDAAPVRDVVTGLAILLVGVLVVHETRYSVIKHPRPPKRGHSRLA